MDILFVFDKLTGKSEVWPILCDSNIFVSSGTFEAVDFTSVLPIWNTELENCTKSTKMVVKSTASAFNNMFEGSICLWRYLHLVICILLNIKLTHIISGMLVTKPTKHQLLETIDFHNIFFHTMEVNRCIPNRVLMHYSMTFWNINSASSAFTLNILKRTRMMHLNYHKK